MLMNLDKATCMRTNKVFTALCFWTLTGLVSAIQVACNWFWIFSACENAD
jgi:hypothetical protein